MIQPISVHTPGPARRLQAVLSPVIPELAALVRDTPGSLSLAQGMVDWAPPESVAPAVAAALAAGGPELHRYGPLQGDPQLLETIAAKLAAHNRLELDGSALLVTAGSNMAFHAVAQAIAEGPPGEPSEVILPLPYYFNHVMAVQLAGAVPVLVEGGAIPDPERLAAAITPRTRAIVTVSPNNPSGVVIPAPVLAAINRLCAFHGLFHITDEAYELFVHGREPHWSAGSLPGSAAHTVSLHSLSKAYGMAGWRLGYMAVPAALLSALYKLQDTVLICPPRLTQHAARAALAAGPAWCAPRLAALAVRRQQLLDVVATQQAQGLPVRLLAEPDGAFYALLQVDGAVAGSLSGDTLMRRLVREHRVAALSGESFGLDAGRGGPVLRLSYGMLGAADLAEALDRLFRGLGLLLA
ncbi:MAG: Aminotransferase class-I [Cyanobacteriota bacterium]